jgi:hypothetical protein
MTPDTKRLLRDVSLVIGLPALLLGGLVANWRPWTYQRDLIRTDPNEERELTARKAGLRRLTWHGLAFSLPANYVLVPRDTLLEVIQLRPGDKGSGSWGSHLALLELTPERRAQFEEADANCSLAPGRCWNESVGPYAVPCYSASGTPDATLWWTPITRCRLDDLGLALAVNAQPEDEDALWAIVRAAAEPPRAHP